MSAPVLELRDVGVELDGVMVLDHVSFSMRRGEVVLVTGPSGCGKSTLLAVAAGLIPHSRAARMWGSVWIDGADATQAPPAIRARTLGYMAQDPSTSLCLTRADDEVAFPLENRCVPTPLIEPALDAVATRTGVRHLLTRDAAALSGGQQQRLALAATLALDPTVVVLDEPLAMLDPDAAHDVATVLAGIARTGVAVLLVEHRLDVLERAGLVASRTLELAPTPQPPPLHRHHRPAQARHDITLRDVRRVPDGPVVQTRVTIPLDPGRVVALTGRNGCGKSTVLLALAGLLPHVASPVGADCGLVLQHPEKQFLCSSVGAELAHVTDPATVHRLQGILHLDADPADSPWRLSVGEQRRLSIICVAAQAHPVVLLDEPTFGLDPQAARGVEQLVCDLAAEGRCVVLSTHSSALAERVADTRISLPPGPDDGEAPTLLRGARRVGATSPLSRCSPLSVFLVILLASLALLTTRSPTPPALGWLVATSLTVVATHTRMSQVLRSQSPMVAFAVGVVLVNVLSRHGPDALTIGLGLGARTMCLAALAVLFVHASDPIRFVQSLHQQAHVPARHTYALLAGARLLQSLPAQWGDLRTAHIIRSRGNPRMRRPSRSPSLFARSSFALLVDSLRQGQRLSEALEARGLGMHPTRSVRHPIRWRASDAVVAAAALALAAGIAVLSRWVGA